MGIQKVDLNSFEYLYNETYNNTLKYVVCKCCNLEDVNDIIQDIYVDFYKLLKKNSVIELNNVNAFIIGIAKNKVKKYYGFKYKIQNMFIPNSVDDIALSKISSDINIEELVLKNINTIEMWDFIKKKKAVIGKIFYLHYTLDMTIKDISEKLEINESTVKSHLYRTLKELSATFKKESDFNVE